MALEAAGYAGFHVTQAQVAGRAGAWPDCAKRDAGRTSALHEYFVVCNDVPFVPCCRTFIPDEDDELFTAMAELFEILDLA